MEKKVLVIGPFGKDSQEHSFREDLEIVFKDIFIKEKGFDLFQFWENHYGPMDSKIFKELVDADLVLADIRGLNPNVMYEVGIRHAYNKPIILFSDEDTKLPWDLDKNYVIRYQKPLQISFVKKLKEEIIQKTGIIFDPNNPPKIHNSFINYQVLNTALTNLDSDIDTQTKDTDLKKILSEILIRLNKIESSGGRVEFPILKTSDRDEIIINLLKDGYTQQEIAEELDTYQPNISTRIKKMRLSGLIE